MNQYPNQQQNYKKTATPRRRKVVSTSSCTTNAISYTNPLIVAMWSLAFPGFGHFLLGNHLFGVLLVCFEFLLNTLSSLNTAIYLSMIGNFDQAKDVLELKYFYVYVPIYIFAVWDSYRRSIEMNQDIQLIIMSKDHYNVRPFSMSPLEVNSLRKKNINLTLVWSFFMPPMLYIYLHRFVTLVFASIWWGALLYFTNIMEAAYYSVTGEYTSAKEVVDPQWFLSVPSVYTFTMYDVHNKANENNKMYEQELIHYLKENYQDGDMSSLFVKN